VKLPVALILAAGVGRRLADVAPDTAKALVSLRGRTLLARSLDALAATGFGDVLVITGHHATKVAAALRDAPRGLTAEALFNPRFATANNIVSFLTPAERLAGGFCLLNADIVFDASILVDVAAAGEGSWLVVDTDEALAEEEMKVHVEGGRVRRISKTLDPSTSAGEFIGIARFDRVGAEAVLDAARALVREGGEGLYYEDAIDRALPELSVGVIQVGGRAWTEIDDRADYERALRVASALDAMDI